MPAQFQVDRRNPRASFRGRRGDVEIPIRLRDGGLEHPLLAGRDGPRAELLRRSGPQLIVPDDPLALVSVAGRYEPKLNETVNDFARHYGV